MERKVPGSAGCSSHTSPFRIPRRSRCDLGERFLLALGSRPCALRMPSPPRRAASRERANDLRSGFYVEPGGRGRPQPWPRLAGRWVVVSAPEPRRPSGQSFLGQQGPGRAGLQGGAPLRPRVAWPRRDEGPQSGRSPGRMAAQQVLEPSPPWGLPHRNVSAAGGRPAGSSRSAEGTWTTEARTRGDLSGWRE
jgi:hypothetical protein